MVPVGSGDKGKLSQLLPGLRGKQHPIIDLRDVLTQLPRQEISDCKAAAQNLERIQSKAIRFILHIHILQPQALSRLL